MSTYVLVCLSVCVCIYLHRIGNYFCGYREFHMLATFAFDNPNSERGKSGRVGERERGGQRVRSIRSS